LYQPDDYLLLLGKKQSQPETEHISENEAKNVAKIQEYNLSYKLNAMEDQYPKFFEHLSEGIKNGQKVDVLMSQFFVFQKRLGFC